MTTFIKALLVVMGRETKIRYGNRSFVAKHAKQRQSHNLAGQKPLHFQGKYLKARMAVLQQDCLTTHCGNDCAPLHYKWVKNVEVCILVKSICEYGIGSIGS